MSRCSNMKSHALPKYFQSWYQEYQWHDSNVKFWGSKTQSYINTQSIVAMNATTIKKMPML